MGRRKIEIKAIKDDRNRSVTFLKRKGGLFKKAYELSVLCSVDVAVIIFGHNKKLYEFSSGDINETIGRYQYYGQAHEHKGPADFNGKRDLDDDDDDDMGSPPPDDQLTQDPPMIPSHLQHHTGFSIRDQVPSASPPMPNGLPFPHRQHTPQPQNGSRPSSRNNVRRTSSSLVPQHHAPASQPPGARNGYAYVPNPSIYNPHGMQAPPLQAQPGQPPFFQYPQPHHPSQQPQMQQTYMQDQRRQSMPPAFAQQERPQQSRPDSSPPQPRPEPQPQDQQLQQPKPMPVKSRSIFTPIEDNRSILAQHSWGIGPMTAEPPRTHIFVKSEKDNRAQSVDVGSVQRNNVTAGPTTTGSKSQRAPTHTQRNQSISSLSDIAAPSRTNSAQLGAKRPQLILQIPSEQSDGGSATADSSPHESAETTGDTPAKGSTDASHSSGVVLPPPSPSASALLSAGAQGPPNPFARPPPPTSTGNQNSNAYNNNNNNNNIETPISALPSRFVADGLLPSPSSFYPEWGFGRAGGDSNMLPSPLNFQTPVVSNGPSFLRDEDGERKRKSPEGDGGQEVGPTKRVKT